MEKWTKKMEVWGTMVIELYEIQFNKLASGVPSELINDT